MSKVTPKSNIQQTHADLFTHQCEYTSTKIPSTLCFRFDLMTDFLTFNVYLRRGCLLVKSAC